MLRGLLEERASALMDAGEASQAAAVASVAKSGQAAINAFLVSNELWGGAGSIADSAGVDGPARARRRIERILVRLGAEQIERGLVNPRVVMWTGSF
jgi:hypothetical protein